MEKVGRNDPCPCGTGKKFKKCCEAKVQKRSLGSAQVLTGASKMSSFFQRHVTPMTASKPSQTPIPEAAPEVSASATV